MRLKLSLTCALFLSAGAVHAADDVRPIAAEPNVQTTAQQTLPSNTDIRIAQNAPVNIANSATPTVASSVVPAVMDAIATSDGAIQQVSRQTVVSVPQRMYSSAVRRPVRQNGRNFLGRVMELERRKNAWLRGMFSR